MSWEHRSHEARWVERRYAGPVARFYQPQFPPGWEHPRGPEQAADGQPDALTGHYRCATGQGVAPAEATA